VKFDVSQVDGLNRALMRLEETYSLYHGSAAAQQQVRAALKLISDDAKGRVHSVTGNLVGSIKVYARVRPVKENLGEVGVSYAKSKAHHAHLVEYGHNVVARGASRKLHPIDAAVKKVKMEELHAKAAKLNKKSGMMRPKKGSGGRLDQVPPHPFFAPACEAQGPKVLDQCEKAIGDLMVTAFKR
jgi:hypothetical protein